ncbi:MAG: TetR/AcrR family transcriptional regulator [Deltaproteobacteria bacterium]|nr:TetR/AcrR family transcriptional regulator [Deltaproteobacteria bacterium]
MPVPAPRSRRHATPATRRAQILHAAQRCIAEKGYHAATMDDIVRAAGLSKGSLYWHFGSKEEVFLALFDAIVEEVFAAWEQEAAATANTLDLIQRQGDIVIERLSSQRKLLRAWAEFFNHPAGRARLAAVYRRTRNTLNRLVRRGISRGELRKLPAPAVSAAITALGEGLVVQAVVDPEFAAWKHWPVMRDIMRRGLAA